jgi:hypothetical protein
VINYLGLVLSAAGIIPIVLNSLELMSVSSLGLITWPVWLGIVMLQKNHSINLKEGV